MAEYANLTAGDPAPWFHQRTTGNPRFAFDTVAGRYVVLCFFATAAKLREANNARLDESVSAYKDRT